MAARKWSQGDLVGEFRDVGSSAVMTVDCTGDFVLLASKRILQFVNLNKRKDVQKTIRKARENTKWEVTAALWNPHNPDSSVFVITRNDVAELYDFNNGDPSRTSTLKWHTRAIAGLDWSTFDSKILATCSLDSNICLWDIRKPTTPTSRLETVQSASQVKWNKKEEHILATSHDRDIRIWDIRKTNRPIYIAAHLKKIHGLDWSPHNGKLLASASQDTSVKFWDYTRMDQQLNIGQLQSPNDSPVWKARFSPFENSLLTVDVSGQLRRERYHSLSLWNIENMAEPTIQHTFVGHLDVVTEFHWRKVHGDQNQLVTWSRDSSLRLWKFESSVKVIDMIHPTGIRSGGQRLLSQDSVEEDNRSHYHNDGSRRSLENIPSESSEEDGPAPEETFGSHSRSPAQVQFHRHNPGRAKTLPNADRVSRPLPRSVQHVGRFQVVPHSPMQLKTLQNEFRLLSTLPNMEVKTDPHMRKCYVTVTCGKKGEHKIHLSMSFPLKYPAEAPKIQFDPTSSVDQAFQTKLLEEMIATAEPLIKKSRACIEPCLWKLKEETDVLENRKSPDTDSNHKIIHTNSSLSLYTTQYRDSRIPFPRTCGAVFCNGFLVTFQKSGKISKDKTPRTFADMSASHIHTPRARPSYYPSQLSRSPKDTSLLYNYERQISRRGHKKTKKEKSGPVIIYDISSLMPLNKSMAKEYYLLPYPASCEHNAEVALKYGRRDLYQTWKILQNLLNEALNPNPDDPWRGTPWATLPGGTTMIQSILEHYSKFGDYQTLAMVCCMFTYSNPERLPIMHHQYSSTGIKHTGGSPSVNGRNSPDKFSNAYNTYHTIHPTDSEFIKDWKSYLSLNSRPATANKSVTSTRATNKTRRTDSLPGSLQDVRNPIHRSHVTTEIEEHRKAIFVLDTSKCTLYDYYKELYADLLLRWGHLSVRANLLKSLGNAETNEEISLICAGCGSRYSGQWCNSCSKRPLICVICRCGVRGMSTFCRNCGHGGHTPHIKQWFDQFTSCPTGCGCSCLTVNAEEI